MITISSIFYGSLFIFKRHVLIISISSFYIGVASGSFFEYIIKDYIISEFKEIIGIIGCLLIISFGLNSAISNLIAVSVLSFIKIL